MVSGADRVATGGREPLGRYGIGRERVGIDGHRVCPVSKVFALYQKLSRLLARFFRRQAFRSQRRVLGDCGGSGPSGFSKLVPGSLSLRVREISLRKELTDGGAYFVKATWEDTVIAESDRTIVIEGNHYFPPNSVKTEYFSPSETLAPVLGKASRATTV